MLFLSTKRRIPIQTWRKTLSVAALKTRSPRIDFKRPYGLQWRTRSIYQPAPTICAGRGSAAVESMRMSAWDRFSQYVWIPLWAGVVLISLAGGGICGIKNIRSEDREISEIWPEISGDTPIHGWFTKKSDRFSLPTSDQEAIRSHLDHRDLHKISV